ncbi:hypothetical protein LCGC14_0538260 [marine sediment metagenome]|uniref:Uncharacterized protein n=1 Tax=marine sediment metagenome TaxID=412755 RepID=A0A0F9V1V2_9ZZZZ|nr:hypothetical protein [bacterium]
MKLIELTQLFWNKQIHTLVSLFAFLVISVNYILPKINSKITIGVYSFLLILIVISGVIQNLEEIFREDKK